MITIVGPRRRGLRIVAIGVLALAACSANPPAQEPATVTVTASQSTAASPSSTAPTESTSAPPTVDSAGPFQSPSGGIYCQLAVGGDGRGSVVCEGGGNYAVPRPADCHLAWGDRFSIDQGSPPVAHCHGDTIRPPSSTAGPVAGVPVLQYGQTRSVGAISCASRTTDVTCTDSTTGRYFRLSRESNQIGP